MSYIYYERKMVYTLATECLATIRMLASSYEADHHVGSDVMNWDAPSICRRELARLAELGITDCAIRPKGDR